MWGFEVNDGLFACDGGYDGFAVCGDFHLVVFRFYQHLAALVHHSPMEGHILDEEVIVLLHDAPVFGHAKYASVTATESPFRSYFARLDIVERLHITSDVLLPLLISLLRLCDDGMDSLRQPSLVLLRVRTSEIHLRHPLIDMIVASIDAHHHQTFDI